MWNCNFNSSITLGLPEDDADASKYLGLLTVYKILFKYVYIYIYIYVYVVHLLLCTLSRTKIHWPKIF